MILVNGYVVLIQEVHVLFGHKRSDVILLENGVLEGRSPDMEGNVVSPQYFLNISTISHVATDELVKVS